MQNATGHISRGSTCITAGSIGEPVAYSLCNGSDPEQVGYLYFYILVGGVSERVRVPPLTLALSSAVVGYAGTRLVPDVPLMWTEPDGVTALYNLDEGVGNTVGPSR